MTVSALAVRLAVEERALRAVLRVECGSDDPSRGVVAGRPLIRVEAHLVLRQLGSNDWQRNGGLRVMGPQLWEGHQVEIDGAWWDYHGRQQRDADGRPGEYDALDVAVLLVGAAGAIAASSWGCAQVLGVPALGYASLREIGASVLADGGLEVLARYLERVDPAALGALRVRDWRGFARAYNGPGKVDDYAAWLAKAYG